MQAVNERDRHICVYSGSVDCGVQGYGFVCDKKSQTSRLAWNLKVLSNSPGSILRSMGQVMGEWRRCPRPVVSQTALWPGVYAEFVVASDVGFIILPTCL